MKTRVFVMLVSLMWLPMFASCSGHDKGTDPKPQPGIVGDLTKPATISIVGLKAGDEYVSGSANNLDTSKLKVVLWAKTDRWYVQPWIASPYTYVGSNGKWSSWTHSWNRMVAVLVDGSYDPGSTRDYHPSEDPGVITWDEFPGKSADVFLDWSGYRWRVKNADLAGPGPNYFSNDTANVSLDSQGRLHLRFDYRDNRWYCSEVMLGHSLGYGTYTFQLDTRVDSLNYNAVFAGFVYESQSREIDMEFSQLLANPHNGQYVVQPWNIPGNISYYEMPAIAQTSHRFIWSADTVSFVSWRGHAADPQPSDVIFQWKYAGANIPPPGGELMRFNLWLFDGQVPTSGYEDEVIVKKFTYTK